LKLFADSIGEELLPLSWITSAPWVSFSVPHISSYWWQRWSVGSWISCVYCVWWDSPMQRVLELETLMPVCALSSLRIFLSPKPCPALGPSRPSTVDSPDHSFGIVFLQKWTRFLLLL